MAALRALLVVLCCAVAPGAAAHDAARDGRTAYAMARQYRNGAGVPRDSVRARAYMESAALAGHAGAMFALSNMLGEEPVPDQAAVRHWLERAVDADDPEALQQMALHLQDGTLGYARDAQRAAQLMRAAAHALAHRRGDALSSTLER